MNRQIKERICDECGKSEQKTYMIFDPVFPKWIRATMQSKDGTMTALDFCSAKCAGKHFTDWKKVPKK